MTGHAFATDDVSEETYAGGLLKLMADYVRRRRGARVGRRAARPPGARRVLLRLHPVLLHRDAAGLGQDQVQVAELVA